MLRSSWLFALALASALAASSASRADAPPASAESAPSEVALPALPALEEVPPPVEAPPADAPAATDAPAAPSEPAKDAAPVADPAETAPDAKDPKSPGAMRFRPWDDDMDAAYGIAEGSIELCDALTFPLRFVPYVGEVASIVFEWACLVPGAFSVDFVGLYHGTQDGQVWQALSALLVAKLWRDLTRWPVVIGIGVVGFGVVVAASAVSFGTPLVGAGVVIPPTYLPVLITGVLVASGVTYVVARKIRKKGQAFIFEAIYGGLAPEFESTERRQEAQDEAWLRTPLNGVERLWALAAVSAGDDADSSLLHVVPVVGRLSKADARAEGMKANMRRLGTDVLDEPKDDYSAVDTTIDIFAKTEGALGAIADVGLILGGALFFGGSVFAALDFQNRGDFTTFAALTVGAGVLGTIVGTSALAFIALREVPKGLRTFVLPIVWGVMPPRGWFTVDEAPPPEPPTATPPTDAKPEASATDDDGEE